MALHRMLRRFLPARWRSPPPVVSVLRLSGVVGTVGPLRTGLSIATMAPIIEKAFADHRQVAVALQINSPGGSPVQSSLIASRIRALAEEKKLPVFAFTEDVAASGGYWLACAGDEIYADESSIIGSIGVVSSGFGLHELITRHGIERRVHTAGARKAMLDPFRPESPDDVARLETIQAEIHESFKALVRGRRGARLAAPDDDLFSGEFWTGRRARELGLVDGIGDLRTVLRAKFGDKVRLRLVQGERRWWWRRLQLASTGSTSNDMAASLGNAFTAVLAAIEERALWSRFGL